MWILLETLLVKYGFWSSEALYSASILFVMFIFLLTSFDTRDYYYLQSNLNLNLNLNPPPCYCQPLTPLLFLLSCFFDWLGDHATFDVLFCLMILWIHTCQTLVPQYQKDLDVCFM